MRYLWVIIIIMGLFTSCENKITHFAGYTVQYVDLEKYQGTWYEIYRLPMRAEQDLVNVTATYSLNIDGTVKVINQGYKYSPTGKLKKAKAKAWRPVDSIQGALIVKFFGLFSSPYLIRALDDEYQWAIVTSDGNSYAWILARKPVLDPVLEQILVDSAEALGIDTQKFIKTIQQW